MTVFSPGPVPRWMVENSRKRVALADFEMGRLALVFQVLRLEADGGVGKKFVARADLARAFDRGVMADAAAVAQLDFARR